MTDQQRKDLIVQARNTDMLQLAGRYTQLRKKGRAEYEGPCPKCGGTDRFVADNRGFFCRECNLFEAGRPWHDPIDFVMWLLGYDFVTAVESLTGGSMKKEKHVTRVTTGNDGSVTRVTTDVLDNLPRIDPVITAAPAKAEQTDDWREKVLPKLAAAQHTLMTVRGGPGAEYLDKRALEPGTWQAFGFGFGSAYYTPTKETLPAIFLPWYRAGKLTAVRYRFLNPPVVIIDGEEVVSKIRSEPESVFGVLYGGQALQAGNELEKTLIIIEGELNAASIWQVAHDTGAEVMSVGSESAVLTKRMIEFASRYRHIIVWMDKPKIAESMRSLLPPRTVSVTSPPLKDAEGVPMKDAKGRLLAQDANDLLRIDMLSAFLTGVRVRACGENRAALEDLLDNMVRAGRLPMGLDARTARSVTKLGAQLDRPVTFTECQDGAWRSWS